MDDLARGIDDLICSIKHNDPLHPRDYKIKQINVQHWRVHPGLLPDPVPTRGKPNDEWLVRYSPKHRWAERYYPHHADPYPRGGLTAVEVTIKHHGLVTGASLCSMEDAFCYSTGRDRACKRAMAIVLACSYEWAPDWGLMQVLLRNGIDTVKWRGVIGTGNFDFDLYNPPMKLDPILGLVYDLDY